MVDVGNGRGDEGGTAVPSQWTVWAFILLWCVNRVPEDPLHQNRSRLGPLEKIPCLDDPK